LDHVRRKLKSFIQHIIYKSTNFVTCDTYIYLPVLVNLDDDKRDITESTSIRVAWKRIQAVVTLPMEEEEVYV